MCRSVSHHFLIGVEAVKFMTFILAEIIKEI